MKTRNLIFALLLPVCGQAQLVVSSGTQLAASGNPPVMIQLPGNIENNSEFDFATVDLNLLLNGFSQQTISGPFTISNLRLSGQGRKILDGNLTITNQINFESSVIQVDEDSKLLFTGPFDGITVSGTPGESYVDGIIFQSGTGNRRFPVGFSDLFAPFFFSDVRTENEIGVAVFREDAALRFEDEIIEVDGSKYWMIYSDDISAIDSKIQVTHTGNTLTREGTTVVVEADAISGTAVNLDNASEGNTLITSARKVTRPIISLGKVSEITPKIHNLITPFGSKDRLNNKSLYIHHLGSYESNKVSLLDRWGVVQHSWTNYDNDNPNYDFGKLTPGSYIVILECTDRNGKTTKLSQMITVLKTN
jgi:hypothetical protein